MYCPMVFQKRLKIALSRLPGGPGNHQKPWMGRYDGISDPGRGHWCHFTYHTFSEDTGIPSWTPGQVSFSLLTLWDPKKLGQDPKPTAGNETIEKTRWVSFFHGQNGLPLKITNFQLLKNPSWKTFTKIRLTDLSIIRPA